VGKEKAPIVENLKAGEKTMATEFSCSKSERNLGTTLEE